MIILFNLLPWLAFISLPIGILYVTYALVKKRTKKYVIRGASAILLTIMILVYFYYPMKRSMPDAELTSVTLDLPDSVHGMIKLEDLKQIEELKQIVEKQRWVRSSEKTLIGISPYPAEEGLNIFVNAKGFSWLIFARKNAVNSSFLNDGGQHYSVVGASNFVNEMFEFAERVTTQKSS